MENSAVEAILKTIDSQIERINKKMDTLFDKNDKVCIEITTIRTAFLTKSGDLDSKIAALEAKQNIMLWVVGALFTGLIAQFFTMVTTK